MCKIDVQKSKKINHLGKKNQRLKEQLSWNEGLYKNLTKYSGEFFKISNLWVICVLPKTKIVLWGEILFCYNDGFGNKPLILSTWNGELHQHKLHNLKKWKLKLVNKSAIWARLDFCHGREGSDKLVN